MTIEKPIQIYVGGVVIDVLSRQEWAQRMVATCQSSAASVPFVHFSVNGQTIALYARSAAYKKLMDAADGRDGDGQSVVMASRLRTSTPLPERVATTDFFHDAARAAQDAGLSFFFLGSNKGNIEIAVQSIRKSYPKLIISGYRNGYFSAEDEPALIRAILEAHTDVLWVGMGSPRQEEFVMRNLAALRGVKWIKTCGGLFDYFSPCIKRAPLWMQTMGLEWLFRTIQEPRKYFRRYLTTNGLALWLLLTKTKNAS